MCNYEFLESKISMRTRSVEKPFFAFSSTCPRIFCLLPNVVYLMHFCQKELRFYQIELRFEKWTRHRWKKKAISNLPNWSYRGFKSRDRQTMLSPYKLFSVIFCEICVFLSNNSNRICRFSPFGQSHLSSNKRLFSIIQSYACSLWWDLQNV